MRRLAAARPEEGVKLSTFKGERPGHVAGKEGRAGSAGQAAAPR